MEEYIKWIENKIEVCLEDKDLQREHWAFCQALKKFREFQDSKNVMVEFKCPPSDRCKEICDECSVANGLKQ